MDPITALGLAYVMFGSLDEAAKKKKAEQDAKKRQEDEEYF
jgi:hypothetical protein